MLMNSGALAAHSASYHQQCACGECWVSRAGVCGQSSATVLLTAPPLSSPRVAGVEGSVLTRKSALRSWGGPSPWRALTLVAREEQTAHWKISVGAGQEVSGA